MAGYGVTPEIIEPQHNSIVPSNDGLGKTAWISMGFDYHKRYGNRI